MRKGETLVGAKRMGWLPPWCPNLSLKVSESRVFRGGEGGRALVGAKADGVVAAVVPAFELEGIRV